MTNPPLLMAIALFAILVGATLPVLYQLHQAAKSARALLETAGPRLERTLEQVGQAAERLDRIGACLERPAQALRPVLGSAIQAGALLGRSGPWLRAAASFGGALLPAVIAGVWAARARGTAPAIDGHTPETRETP